MTDTQTPSVPATPETMRDWLRAVEDPELFMSLVDLGLVYTVEIREDTVFVTMTLTSPGCPSAGYLVDEMKKRAMQYPGITHADVQIVFEPKWDPREMASDEVKDRLGIW